MNIIQTKGAPAAIGPYSRGFPPEGFCLPPASFR